MWKWLKVILGTVRSSARSRRNPSLENLALRKRNTGNKKAFDSLWLETHRMPDLLAEKAGLTGSFAASPSASKIATRFCRTGFSSQTPYL